MCVVCLYVRVSTQVCGPLRLVFQSYAVLHIRGSEVLYLRPKYYRTQGFPKFSEFVAISGEYKHIHTVLEEKVQSFLNF